MIIHEGGWSVQVECADCSAHTVYVEYDNDADEIIERGILNAMLFNDGSAKIDGEYIKAREDVA